MHDVEQVLNARARPVTERLLQAAHELGIEPTVFVLAAADAVAITAALLDEKDGRNTLADKMHAFNARVERSYAQYRQRMATTGAR